VAILASVLVAKFVKRIVGIPDVESIMS
jgi:hypothetical protein